MLRSSTIRVASSLRPRAVPFRLLSTKPSIKVTFIKPTGERVTVSAPIGDSLLEVAHANKIDVEGACGGETACSTCHVILTKPFFDKVPEPSEAEEDMLDLALGLTKTSRLGCQVFAASNLDGMEVTLPKEVNNMKKDD